MALLPSQPSTTKLDVPLTLEGEEVDSRRVRLADPDPADDDDDEEADSDQGQELSAELEPPSADDTKKSHRVSPIKNQQVMPREPLIVGDILIDVPAAEEYGDLGVSTLKEDEAGDFDAFMTNYGIVVHAHKKTRLSKYWLTGYLPECIAWMPLALMESMMDAAQRATEEDEDDLADEAVHDTVSFKLRLRQRMLTSVGGTMQDGQTQGSLQLFWAMFRTSMRYINRTSFFRNFFGCLIVFNTVYMGFEVDNDWDNPLQNTLNHVFVALFLMETIVRMTATEHFTGTNNSFLYYKNGGSSVGVHAKASRNNSFLYFDSSIVLVSVIDKWILPVILRVDSGTEVKLIQVFRVCRILRLARLLRLVQFLRPLRLMERSLRRGVAHFLSIMTFLVFFLYAASLIFIYQLKTPAGKIAFENQPDNYTENVLKLMVYLFEAMFCGFDWVDSLAKPLLSQKGTRGVGVLLIIFMFCTKLALCNLITSSMVENYFATTQADTVEMEEEDLYRYLDVSLFKQLIEEVDKKNLGRISWKMFASYAHTHENGPKLLNLLGIRDKATTDYQKEVQLLEMWKVFQALDVAGEEAIPYEVFCLGYVKLKASKKKMQGLIFDYLLKHVLLTVCHQEDLVSPMERHIYALDNQMLERVRHLKHIQMDIEEIVKPVDAKLSQLERTFAEASESMKPPTSETEVVPVGCAGHATMMLQNEIDALKLATEAFLASRGIGKEDILPAPTAAWMKLTSRAA